MWESPRVIFKMQTLEFFKQSLNFEYQIGGYSIFNIQYQTTMEDLDDLSRTLKPVFTKNLMILALKSLHYLNLHFWNMIWTELGECYKLQFLKGLKVEILQICCSIHLVTYWYSMSNINLTHIHYSTLNINLDDIWYLIFNIDYQWGGYSVFKCENCPVWLSKMQSQKQYFWRWKKLLK